MLNCRIVRRLDKEKKGGHSDASVRTSKADGRLAIDFSAEFHFNV